MDFADLKPSLFLGKFKTRKLDKEAQETACTAVEGKDWAGHAVDGQNPAI